MNYLLFEGVHQTNAPMIAVRLFIHMEVASWPRRLNAAKALLDEAFPPATPI